MDLTGFFYTARHAVPHLLRGGGGSLVVTSSAAAFSGGSTRPAYSTSKARPGRAVCVTSPVDGARKAIRCNAVAPGLVLSAEVRPKVPAERQEAYLGSQLLSRLGEPRDIAAMVTFLFSDAAEWITGQIFGVDGGMVLR